MKPHYYYLETDGQVFLVKDGKTWRFPKNQKELPCRFKPIQLIPIGPYRVLYAKPLVKQHPHNWFHKDEVIGRPEIAPVVQQAINRSLPRTASKVAIIENEKVLMVKANRGITKGYWNLPGGFIGYTEHPEKSVLREVEEEIGLTVQIERLLGIYADTFTRTGGYMISFVYLGKRKGKAEPIPNPDEIESIAWVPLQEALRSTKNPFAIAGLKDYLKNL